MSKATFEAIDLIIFTIISAVLEAGILLKAMEDHRKDFVVTLPIDRSKKRHTLSFIIGDPGQMIQKITYK